MVRGGVHGIHPDDARAVAGAATSARAGTPAFVRYRVLDEDGGWRWQESVFAEVTSDGPTAIATRDVHAEVIGIETRRQTQERYEAALTASADPIIVHVD